MNPTILAAVEAASKRRSKTYITTKALVQQLGVSRWTIERARTQLGVSCTHARRDERRSRVYIQAAVVGLSTKEIGRREGVTHKHIEREIRAMGIQAECRAARKARKAELKIAAA